MEKLAQLLNDHQTGMSKFQDDFLVTTRAGGTMYGQYKQSLRELYKRFRGLRQSTASHKRLLIEIEELEYNIEELSNKVTKKSDFEKRKLEVDLHEKQLLVEESERGIADTKREFINFYKQAVYLKDQIGELTEAKREELDRDMWMFKIKEMACIDFITSGRLRNSTFEFIHACPKNMKLKLLSEIKDHGKLITWYENKDEYHIPEQLPDVDFNIKYLEVLL